MASKSRKTVERSAGQARKEDSRADGRAPKQAGQGGKRNGQASKRASGSDARGRAKGRGPSASGSRANTVGLVIGWVLVGGGALAVLWLALPPLPGTVGSGWLNFVPDARLTRAPGVGSWLALLIVFGPLIGFNLVYFFGEQRSRRRHLTWLLVVTGTEVLTAMLTTLWLSGAGVAPARVIEPAGQGIGILGVCLGVPGVTFVAAAIMTWLSLGTDFDSRAAEYFATGRTRVNVKPRSARSVAWTLCALAALWLLLLLPVLPAARNLDGTAPVTGATRWAWPLPYLVAPQLIDTLRFYLVIVAIAGSFVASVLVSKLLYARPLSALASRSRGRHRRGPLRLLLALRHYPFMLAGIIVSIALTEPATQSDGLTDLGPSFIAAAVAALVGLLMISQVWRVRDLTAPTLRLHQGGYNG